MIPDDPELRRALDARSAPPSPEFEGRFRQALGRGRPMTNWMPAVALVTVVVLSLSSVGVLLAARTLGHHGPGIASGSRTPSASPGPAEGRSIVSAPSDQVAWVLVEPNHLYRSTDRGTHWESRLLPAEVGVRPSISFVSASVGWLLAPGSPATQCQEAPAEIWHTTDAGATWQRLAATGLGDAQCKELIYFADQQHGFVTAWDQNHQPTVYATFDGGRSWRKSVLPDGPLFVTQGGGFTLRVGWITSFGSTLYLEASGAQDDAGWRQRDFIFTSTDGGATWSFKQKLASAYTSMVTESRWLQLAPDVEETVNGGQQFHPYPSNFRGSMPRATFATAEVGYATDGNNVVRTVDGGAHWAVIVPGNAPTPQPSPSPVELPSQAYLSAPSRDVVWAFADSRLLYVSQDHGETWDQRRLPVQAQGGAQLTFSFVDAVNGWALGAGTPATQCQAAGAQVWRTSDGAETWHVVTTVAPPDGNAHGLAAAQCKEFISFVDTTHGFVTAWDPNTPPTIYRTADGGDTWKSSRLPDPPGFKTSAGGDALIAHEVHRFGSTLLLTAYGMQPSGSKGYVFESVDGGATWQYAASLPNSVTEVAFVSGSRWVQLILPGQSVETTDAGRTWHAYASDYQQAAPVSPQVVFGDASVGYATVRGSIQRTEDGGLHWSYINTPGVAQPG